MEVRDLSKMQIRAEILLMLQQLSVHEEVSKSEQDKYIDQIASIANREDVIDILVKEFARADNKKAQIISFLLIELGNIEKLKDILWSYIKDPKIPDYLKDLASITLRNLGDNSDPELFLSYLDNPKEIIDKETQRLLETAAVNPEAQIDFLDFLFALPEDEQISLVQSLKDDYPGDYLANVLITAIESKPSDKLKEVLVEAIGETRSIAAVPILYDLTEESKNEHIRKLAKKSLNVLKLSGINIEQARLIQRGSLLCEMTDIYECYTSMPDGSGCQGIIVSRIKDNEDVLMFSSIISDFEGILDCFGFNGISVSDYERIIDRFQEGTTRISVSAEYCKYILSKFENINKSNDYAIPYEYIAWKSLLSDIIPLQEPLEETALEWANPEMLSQGDILYKHPDFKHWFLEDRDHPVIKPAIDRIIQYTLEKKDYYLKNPDEYKDILEKEIAFILPDILDKQWREIYKQRLLHAAYLLSCQDLTSFMKIASSTAAGLDDDNNISADKNPFFKELMKRTILEGFLRYQHQLAQENKPKKLASWGSRKGRGINNIPKTDLIEQDISGIINILYINWLKD